MTQLRLEYSARTDKGMVRGMNEDAYGTLPDNGIVVVADGMGGYRAGEVASRLAVDTTLRHLNKHMDRNSGVDHCLNETEHAVEQANLAIWRATDETPELKGMGTTVLIGVFGADELAFTWVGDSRLYLMRNGRLVQLTIDHTLVQDLVDKRLFASVTEAMAAGVGDNVLTRALGAEELVPPDTGSVDIVDGDLYLFCTDGLNHMLNHSHLQSILSDPKLDLNAKADRLIKRACDAGGEDNITVVLVKVASGQVLSGQSET